MNIVYDDDVGQELMSQAKNAQNKMRKTKMKS